MKKCLAVAANLACLSGSGLELLELSEDMNNGLGLYPPVCETTTDRAVAHGDWILLAEDLRTRCHFMCRQHRSLILAIQHRGHMKNYSSEEHNYHCHFLTEIGVDVCTSHEKRFEAALEQAFQRHHEALVLGLIKISVMR